MQHRPPVGERPATRSSTGFLMTMGTAVGVGLVIAGPAGAISSITNTISMSRSSLDTGQTVTIKGDTDYGSSSFLPNPYYSNFRNSIDAVHFNRPAIYSENCEGSEYYYASSDSWTEGDPSYRFDCGTFFVVPSKERHVYSHATTRSDALGSGTRLHQQGQFNRGTVASYGANDTWRTTFSDK